MVFICFEWLEFEQLEINIPFGRYGYFAPDIWWLKKEGCYQTVIQDFHASYGKVEIVTVCIIPKREVMYMWE